jgi:hypothetical protein
MTGSRGDGVGEACTEREQPMAQWAVMATPPILSYGAALGWMIWVLRHH